MGSGGGGGGGGSQAQMAMMRPPDLDIPVTGYPGLGPTQVDQTFTPQAKPPWMQGSAFGAPWWGMNAATGQSLGQQNLQPQAPPPAQQAPQAPPTAGKGAESLPDTIMGQRMYGGLNKDQMMMLEQMGGGSFLDSAVQSSPLLAYANKHASPRSPFRGGPTGYIGEG